MCKNELFKAQRDAPASAGRASVFQSSATGPAWLRCSLDGIRAHMKSKRIARLQAGSAIALVICALMAVYMFWTIPAGQPMWSSVHLAESEIKSADLPRLQSDLRSAVASLAAFRHDKNELLLVCFLATIAMTAFLGWSLLMIWRIKREDSAGASNNVPEAKVG